MPTKIKKIMPYLIEFIICCIVAIIVYIIRINTGYGTHPGGEVMLIFIPIIVWYIKKNYSDFKELKTKYNWEDYDIFEEEP